MDKKFEALLIEAEKIRGNRGTEYVRYAKRVEDQGTAWGLLTGDTEESLAYRAETAAYILETYHGETIGSVLHLPIERKLEIVKRGEEAAGVPKLQSIKEHGAFPECVPVLATLKPGIQRAVEVILRGDENERHTQIILEELKRCGQCGLVSATFGWYKGGYGYSVDGGFFTEVFDRDGNKVEQHNCGQA